MTATRYEASAVAQRAAATTAPMTSDRAGQLDERGELGREPQLVGDRAGREVVLGRDRVADLPDEGREVRPGAGPGDERGGDGEARQHDRPAATASPPAGEDRPDEDDPRLELDRRPQRCARPEPDRVVEPAPADREQQEQDRPDLAELDRVGERPRQPGQQDDPPADRARSPAGPRRRPRTTRSGSPVQVQTAVVADSSPNGRIERRERRRVVEEPEPAGRLEAHVVQRLAVQQADRGLVIGEEVEAERVAGRETDVADDDDERRGSRRSAAPPDRAGPVPAGPSRPGCRAPPAAAMDERDPEQVPGDAQRPGPDWRASATRACRTSGSARSPSGSRAAGRGRSARRRRRCW